MALKESEELKKFRKKRRKEGNKEKEKEKEDRLQNVTLFFDLF